MTDMMNDIMTDTITHYALTLSILFSCVCILAGALTFIRLRAEKRQEKRKIRMLCGKVEAILNDSAKNSEAPAFSDSLDHAAMVTKFQQPRLELQTGKLGEVPEKYKFFANLAARGMSTDEISEVLGISLAEAGQLATLAFISSKGSCFE